MKATRRGHYAHLNQSSPRAESFLRIFGGLDVPIKSPVPCMATIEAAGGDVSVFLIDLERVDLLARERLISYLADKFGDDEATVATELFSPSGGGVFPILAEDVGTSTDSLWFI